MTKLNFTETQAVPVPDPLPFDAVYRRMAPSVFGYLKAQGVEDPESVTHDVFLAALPRLNSIRGGEGGVRTLLFSIATPARSTITADGAEHPSLFSTRLSWTIA